MSEELTPVSGDNTTEVVESKQTNKQLLSEVKDKAKMNLVQRVSVDWPEIVDAQIDLAKGIWVEKEATDPTDGKRKIMKIYPKPPSAEAGQYLINQVVGKPIETLEEHKTVNLIFDNE